VGYDKDADIDLRYTAGVGLGRKFVDTDHWKFEGEAGLNYFVEKQKGESSDGYVAARLYYRVNYIHSETWSADHSVVVYPSLEDKDDVVGRMDTGVQAKLTDSWYAKARWIWDYDNTPAEGNKRSDQMHLLTLGWGF
jgi:putative salt-induced outer membrane protein YdiY